MLGIVSGSAPTLDLGAGNHAVAGAEPHAAAFDPLDSLGRYELFPLLDANGDYIIEAEETELWMQDEFGQIVLRADGITPQPPDYGPHLFQEMKIRRQLVTYNGPDARPVDVRNFLAPLDAPDLQGRQADTVVHYYDMTAIEIVEQFISRMQQSGRWDPNQYPRTLEYLRRASANGRQGTPKSRAEPGETNAGLRADPVIRVAEVYRWYDATQTGQLDNLYLLVDRDTRQPLLYEHVANVFEDGRRPFTPVQWWPVEGRWTGIGAVEVFWELQKFIDLQTNRWDLSLSESGSKTFFNPEQTVEGQLNPRLTINDQTTFRKRDVNVPAERILERVHLHEFKGAKIEGLVQFVGQIFTNMSGVANANDAAAMGMDTARLATGVNNIQHSGEEMFTPILVNLEPGIAETIADCLALAVEHMDEREAFEVTGPDGVVHLKELQRQDARQFRWHVGLEVTSSKGEREVAQAAAATEAGKDYLSLPPAWQTILAPLYRQRLKAHGVKDVHKIIVPPTPEQLQAYQAQQQGQGGAAATPNEAEAPPPEPLPQ